MSTLKIGVYFGSFDPIHINHINLCKDLIERGFSHVYLVPNQNSYLKPYMVSHDHRLQMIGAMIIENGLDGQLIAYKSNIEQHSWEGRTQVCEDIRKQHEECLIYQIIGQDSYEKALERCQIGKGIYALNGRRLIVYPRENHSLQINIPTQLSNVVEVVDSYKDLVVCSSTIIREKLLNNCQYSELQECLSESVHSYIVHNNLYKKKISSKKVIVILGPPGSGKGSLCSQLIKMYPKYKHISTGDIYREDQIKKTAEYQILVEAKKEGNQKYMEALNLYIIKKLKQIIKPNGHYLIDGLKPTDLRDFEDNVAPIDGIAILNCKYETAFERLKKRQKEENRLDDTDESIKKRLSNYYHYLWVQKEIIKSYQGTGREAININCQKPVYVLVKIPIWNLLLKK